MLSADAQVLNTRLLQQPELKTYLAQSLQRLELTAYCDDTFCIDCLGTLSQLQDLRVCSHKTDSKWETQGLLTSLSALTIFVFSGTCQTRGHVVQRLSSLKYLTITRVLAGNLKASEECFTALQTLVMADPETDDMEFRHVAFTLLPKHATSTCLVGQSFGLLGILSICQCCITAEPTPLRLMPCLTRVDFTNCKFETEDWLSQSLTAATQLKRLKMISCGLEDIPGSLCDLLNLTSLKLNCNGHLKALPLSLSSLTALALLKASCCDLIVVPEVLQHLSSLERIHLEDNYRMQIRSSLTYLLNFKNLHCSAGQKLIRNQLG